MSDEDVKRVDRIELSEAFFRTAEAEGVRIFQEYADAIDSNSPLVQINRLFLMSAMVRTSIAKGFSFDSTELPIVLDCMEMEPGSGAKFMATLNKGLKVAPN